MLHGLPSVVSSRFLKFCTVGASGVAVNLALLAVFADGLGVQVNLASALAIEVSICSNFLINETWTFRDRRSSRAGFSGRLAKFHMVSLAGAIVQWGVFIAANIAWLLALGGASPAQDAAESVLERWVVAPVVHPPDVGGLKYLSQLLGVGAATAWNYLVNFHWTWDAPERGSDRGRR